MKKTMRTSILALAFASLTGTAMARSDIEILARTCYACHGVGGVSAGTSMPSIGGLPQSYLRNVMKQWKSGERSATTMNRIVQGLSDAEIDALADYFADQRWVPAPQPISPDVLAKGEAAISDNCEDCHGSGGHDPEVGAPRLNGQWVKYMELELEKYRSADFKMPNRKMRKAANETKPADTADAARYFGARGR